MTMYSQEIVVNWGESDPFGLVYFPRMLAWFNDLEHNLFRQIGHPVTGMIREMRTAFVMGEVHFRFIGPAAYGDRVTCTISLKELRDKTIHWNCKAQNTQTMEPITEGLAIRVFARINDDGTLTSSSIPGEMRDALTEMGNIKAIKTHIDKQR